MEALVPFGYESGVGAELLDVFLNGFVKAGDQRGHEHNDADAEDNAKNGETAAHLMRAKRVHRLLEIFAVCLRHFSLSDQVSARNASMGSNFAARVAG